jgi:NitT/TauT family transport system substrate-binding protein
LQGALSGGEFVVSTYCRNKGISPQSIVFVDVPPESVLDQMPKNIQGGWTWEPNLTLAKAKGFKVLLSTADAPGMVPDVVAFRQSVITARPQEIKGFINAWFDAIEFWRKNPQIAHECIARVIGSKPQDISLQGCKLLTMQDNWQAFNKQNYESSIYSTAEKQVEFFVTVGDIAVFPNINDIIDAEFFKRRVD